MASKISLQVSKSPNDEPDSVDNYDEIAERHFSLARVLALLHPHRISISFVVFLIAVAGVAGVASPFLIRSIVDDALPAKDLTLLGYLAG
ncbi:hypothetical protein SB786_35875, partial [Burkholderia sp. SIMBA_062]